MAFSLRFLLILLVLALSSVVAVSSVALADEGDIDVLRASAESQFPEGILFSVEAQSQDIIDEVRVFINKADQSGRSAYRSIEVEPGESVSGETLLPVSGSADYFPPGTKITYYFEVRDKAGAVVRTERTDFVYEDSRFDWLTLSEGLITVYYYSEFVEERARIILEAAKETMDSMVSVLGIAPTDPLRIVTYNNYRHMVMALPFRSQAVSQDLQAQGMAFSDERVLLIHGFDPTVTGTVSHEFTHLLVAEAAGGSSASVPSWLNEGLAEYGNIDPTDEYDAALRYGIYTRRIRPLWYQGSFSGEPEDILIAYGQGKSVVNFMVRRWGEDKISDLFTALRNSRDIDIALVNVYGLDQYGMDTAWRNSLGLEPLPSPEELASRIEEAQEESSEGGSVTADAGAESSEAETQPAASEGDSAEPTIESELAVSEEIVEDSTQEEDPAPPEADRESNGSSSPCSAPPEGSAAIGLGTLALMAGPVGLGALPFLRRFSLKRFRRKTRL